MEVRPHPYAQPRLIDIGLPSGWISSKPVTNQHNLSEIKSLKEVTGSSTVGDNQFTNNESPTCRINSERKPIFYLTNAYTTLISGKTALLIEGRFVTEDGSPLREFIGVFLPRDEQCSIIHEAYLEGKSEEKLKPSGFIVYRGIYRQCLQTICF